ncbi:GNAT family N-acetyltransferase [Myxococcota bacterium]|nr:GNAT family N-acetyltransferase [Myxococcota bacterium]
MERCFPHFLCEENASHLWIEESAGEVVGHVGYLPDTWETPRMAWRVGRIGAVCTEESQRGGGVGTRLLLAAMEGARKEGVDLFVISGDRGLYARQGGVRCASIERVVLEKSMLSARRVMEEGSVKGPDRRGIGDVVESSDGRGIGGVVESSDGRGIGGVVEGSEGREIGGVVESSDGRGIRGVELLVGKGEQGAERRLRGYVAEDQGRWMEIAAQESVRWGRSEAEWRVVLGGEIVPWMREAVHRAYSVCAGEQVVASLVLWERSTYTEVIEWAGDRAGVLVGLAEVGRRELCRFPLRWSVPWHERQILRWLREQGVRGEGKEGEGVICVLAWEGLTERIQRAFREAVGVDAATVRLEEEGDIFSMVWGDGRLRWQGRGTLARLLFGEPAFGYVDGVERLPLPVFEGAGAWGRWEEVKRLLPFARPVYGLSYI